jgi:hypothetical protein
MELFIGLLLLASLPYFAAVGGLVAFAANENGVGPLLPLAAQEQVDEEQWCERYDHARGHAMFPVHVPPTDPRSEVSHDVDVLACRRRLIEQGHRSPLADALLLDLATRTSALVSLAVPSTTSPGRVFVEAFTPDVALSQKIATAARSALHLRGLEVARLAPLPAADDVDVWRSMPTADAIAHSCERLFAEGQLQADELFVALAVVDPFETELHVGSCAAGRFRWLQ